MATLAEASLSAQERRALERFALELERQLGDELRGVWLYGSRARGERTGPESDVDLLVITASRQEHGRVRAILDRVAEAEGANHFYFPFRS
jgi:predicted nucleotidyltransferase